MGSAIENLTHAQTVATRLSFPLPLPPTESLGTRLVTTAEIHFATFVAEHNLSFMCPDHSKLSKVMFPSGCP